MPERSEQRQVGCLLEIDDLRFSFHDQSPPLDVIDGISLRVEPGSLVAVLGPSGCGKTTLLRVLAGLWRPSSRDVDMSGSIRLDGEGPVAFAAAGRTEFFFQTPVLLPWLSLDANLVLPMRLRGQTPAEQDVVRSLELTELHEFRSYLPSQLSGGMRQRAVLARSLLRKPSFMPMDEPFGSLDDETRENVDAVLLRFLQAWPATVLFVTHNIREAAVLGDRIVILGPRPTRVVRVLEGLPRERRVSGADLRELMAVEQSCRKELGRNA